MMPSLHPTVEVDGARATITIRNVDGEQIEVLVDLPTARKLALELTEKLMEANR